MGAPAAVVAARFAWVGYKDRIPFLGRRDADDPGAPEPAPEDQPRETELVEAGSAPP